MIIYKICLKSAIIFAVYLGNYFGTEITNWLLSNINEPYVTAPA